jgi:hypothetical protein
LYVFPLQRDYRHGVLAMHKKEQNNTTKTTFREVLMIIKSITEFGYPAVLDILFIRPFCMYWLPTLKR